MMPKDSDLPLSGKLKNFTKEEARKLVTIETAVKEIIPKAVDAKIGMFVKEIYRTWNNEKDARA